MDAAVVVADDDAEMREMIAAMLWEHPNVQVVHAVDGEHALHVLRNLRARVLLLDMQMPVLDGPATLRAIRADPELRKLPVVGMSAASLEGAARAAGCDAFLRKPFKPGELVMALRPYLDDVLTA